MAFEEPFEPKAGGSGVSDHGALTGLDQDHHLQYHTDARGDARYKQLTNERITERPATDAASTYPLGISVMEVATSAGWPASAGTVETLRYSDGRTVQVFREKNSTLTRVRWWNEVGASWSSFAIPNVADFASASHVGSGGAAHAAATDAVQGFIELATQAEVDAETDAARAVTPTTLAPRIASRAAAISPFPNLMPDSGRFAGRVNPLTRGLGTAGFTNSPFFAAYNGSSVASAGKFVHNNTATSTSLGDLTQDVWDLLTAMGRAPGSAAGKFGAEFYVASYAMGTGTLAGRVGADGVTRYPMTDNGARAIFGFGNRTTCAMWIRFKTAGAAGNKVDLANANSIRVNGGAPISGDLQISPDATSIGWWYVNTQMVTTIGYNNSWPLIHARAGDVVQIAVPAFYAGEALPGMHTAPMGTFHEALA